MAEGKPVGTMFVELSMDATKYTKAQKDILAGAERNSADINKVFSTVGTKSDEMYNAMRKNIENALGAIKQSHLSSADEIRRAQESAAAKITQINEQQYGHQTSIIDNLKKNWLGMTAAATAAFMAIKAIVAEPIAAYMESETALLKMGMAMKNQGDFTRSALADMEEYSKQVQAATAYEDDAVLAIMGKMKSFGMANEQVKQATQAAIDMSAFTGQSIDDTSQIMGKAYMGITTGLKRVGLQIEDNIPKAEIFNSVMMQVEQRFGGSAQAELLTYAGQWKYLKNQWQDIQEFLGLVFLKTMQGLLTVAGLLATTFLTAGNAILGMLRIVVSPVMVLLDGIARLAELSMMPRAADALRSVSNAIGNAQENIKSARDGVIAWTSKNYDNMTSLNKVSNAIDNMGKAGERTQIIDDESAKATKKAAEEKQRSIEALTEAIRKQETDVATIGQTQYQKDIARIDSEAAAWQKKSGDKVKTGVWAQNELTKAWKKSVEEQDKIDLKAAEDQMKRGDDNYNHELKIMADTDETKRKQIEKQKQDSIKAGIEYRDIVADNAEFAATENERAINKIIAQENQKIDKLWDAYTLQQDEEIFTYEEYQAEKTRIHEIGASARLEKETEQAKKIADLNYNLVKDIQGYEEIAYNMRITQLNTQAEVDIKNGADRSLVMAALTEQTIKAYIDMGKSSNDFTLGVTAGFLEMQRAQTEWGTVGYNIIKTAATDAAKQLDDNLFLFVKGQWSAMKLDFQTIMDDMLKILTAKIAEMIIQWGLYQAAVATASLMGVPVPGGFTNPLAPVVAGATTAGINALIPGATATLATAGGGAGLAAYGGGITGAGVFAVNPALAPGAAAGTTAAGAGITSAATTVATYAVPVAIAYAAYSVLSSLGGGGGGGGGPSPGWDLSNMPIEQLTSLKEEYKPYLSATFTGTKYKGRGEDKRETPEYTEYWSNKDVASQIMGAYADRKGLSYEWGTVPNFKTGLDYVPRDMPVVVHQKEAILNEQEADVWRGGGEPAQLHVHVYVDGREVRSTVADGMTTDRELIKAVKRIAMTVQ